MAIQITNEHGRVRLKTKKLGCFFLNPNEIIYAESIKHKLLIYTETDLYVVYARLDNLQNALDDRFVRIHKSFLVHEDSILGRDGRYLTTKNGKLLPISRIHMQECKERFKKKFF